MEPMRLRTGPAAAESAELRIWKGVRYVNQRLLLLLNPCAGQKRANRYLPEIVRLYNDRGYECAVYVTACSGDATPYVRDHAAEYERIVCIGGDGTLNETISGLVESGVDRPVGYIAAGTTNDYANSLGLSADIMQAAKDAVDGEGIRFDLGSFNGRQFIYTASCGAFARTSYTTPQLAKNLLGHLAYILEGIQDLPSLKPIRMRVECDDRVVDGEFLFCAVTNSISVGGILKLDRDLVRLNDGLFEVMLIKNPRLPSELMRILLALRSSDLPCDMIHFFTADHLTIETESDVEWTLDGERGACDRRFEVLNLHRRVELVLPSRAVETVPVEPDSVEAEDAEAETVEPVEDAEETHAEDQLSD